MKYLQRGRFVLFWEGRGGIGRGVGATSHGNCYRSAS